MQEKRIEIEIEKLDTFLSGIAVAMGDKNFHGIVTTHTISFMSQEPEIWSSSKRLKDFEKKYNEDLGTTHESYKVKSIKVIC